MNRLFLTALLLLTLVAAPGVHSGQQAGQSAGVALSNETISRLPADYRVEARSVRIPAAFQQDLRDKSDEDLTEIVIHELGRRVEMTNFLLDELPKEHSAKLRETIIRALHRHWKSDRASNPILEHCVSDDPDAAVALAALDELRTLRLAELSRLLDARIASAKKRGDSHALEQLALERTRHYGLYSDIELPGFMRVPPAVFDVLPGSHSIRVLAFGDFGVGDQAQVQTASAMVRYNSVHRFDFGITLGDNFYPRGMDSTRDSRWETQFEHLYGPMNIKVFAALGNHDYGQPDSPAAEILYSDKSAFWRMPAPYYTFRAGPVQFFAIDTMDLSQSQLLWLDGALSESRTPWKVVYGHYPIYSATSGDNAELIQKLLPILKKAHVNIYLDGHDHNLQEVKAVGGVHFFVSGGGGAGLAPVRPDYQRSTYKDKRHGFTVLEADARNFTVRFVDISGDELHSETLNN